MLIRPVIRHAGFLFAAILTFHTTALGHDEASEANDPSIEERFAELEREVALLSLISEGESEAFESCCAESERKIEAVFGDGFALVSPDEEYELRFHILNQVDYKAFSPSNQEPAAQDGVYIPRMRIYFEGRLTEPFQYEISLQRSVEGEFDLLDANLDIKFTEAFQVRFGRTIIPYSYTWYDHLEQYFIVPERPLFPLNYGLSRAAGVQIWGEGENRRWEYSLGVYDGRQAGLADNSTTTDGVAYLNFRPFVNRKGSLFRYLNFGASFAAGDAKVPTELLPARTSIQSSENDEASFSASAVFLEVNPDVVATGDRLLGAVHAALYAGPISIEGEWNLNENQLLNEATDETLASDVAGWHITVASFITGETVKGREAVVPLRPVDPRCGCSQLGAIELYARYSNVDIDDQLFARNFADGADWTNEVSMTDIGFNWYLNRYTKFYFDWQHAAYASPVLINENTDARSSYNDLYWLRCQVYF